MRRGGKCASGVEGEGSSGEENLLDDFEEETAEKEE